MPQHCRSPGGMRSAGAVGLGSGRLHPECPTCAKRTCGTEFSSAQSVSIRCINSICTNTGLLKLNKRNNENQAPIDALKTVLDKQEARLHELTQTLAAHRGQLINGY